jgi:hypothetical protein
MVAGNGELVGEEAVTEEVLMSEASAVGSSLERLLDVAAETTVLQAVQRKQRWPVVALTSEQRQAGDIEGQEQRACVRW